MFSRNIRKKNLIQIFIFFGWMSMWISINSMPGELAYMNNNIITFVNGMRTIFAIIFSCLTIILATYLFIKNAKFNSKLIILKIFLIYFISQIVGLTINQDRLLDLNNIYLVLYAICTISILHVLENKNFQNLIPFFMYFIPFILILSVFFVFITNSESIFSILYEKNLYYLLHPDVPLAYQAPPRITGLSRTISIINIFLIIFYLINHKKYYSYLVIFFIYLLSVFIWLAQSRGTIICFYISSALLIFFFNNLSYLKKIIIYCIITLFSISSANFIINLKTLNNFFLESYDKVQENLIKTESEGESESEINDSKFSEVTDKILNIEESRFITIKNTSGRTDLWRLAFKEYDKKKIFGYGPQADRVLLSKLKGKYGTNVSNATIYAFLSGGYPSLFCILIIYFYFTYLVIFFFVKKKLYNGSFKLDNKNRLYIASITFCIFFFIRSLIENSFSVFSIDFLIIILSLFIIEKSKNKKIM
jgi:hypothetical protein